jgi:tRNA uridine 5-carboxymethylaminomethyl modification enzyme
MFRVKRESITREKKRIAAVTLPPSPELNAYLESSATTRIETGVKLVELLRRPQLGYAGLLEFDGDAPTLKPDVAEQVEISVKYEGYIKKQISQVENLHRIEEQKLPEDINYAEIRGIRLEAREKLAAIRPQSIGQASRISGVSPADIAVLAIYLKGNKHGTT